MPVRLLFHVAQEMRLLSSIIKGGRIRNQTFIDLSERLPMKNAESDNTKAYQEEADMALVEEEQMRLIQAKTEGLIEEAKQKADQIIEEALKEAETIKRNAEEEKNKRLEEAINCQKDLIKQAEEEKAQIYQEALSEKKEIIEGIESELAETLKTLLSYLVGEEVYNNTQWLVNMIRRMLVHDSLKNELKVYVSPPLYDRLTEKEKNRILNLGEEITLQASELIGETACRVESKEGAIEYDVKESLERVISDIRILQNLN